MKFKIGDIITCQHRYAFRSGRPSKIISIQKAQNDNDCYFIQYEDGFIDWLPISEEEVYGMILISDLIVGGKQS